MKPCLRCGVPTSARYCALCLPFSHRRRSWRWDKLSRRYRRLYGCAECGRRDGTQLHHVIPLSKGGAEYDPSNLQVLCEAHHAEAHRVAG